MARLSLIQRRVLLSVARRKDYGGSRPLGRTIRVLERLGLIECELINHHPVWRATPAGMETVAKLEKEKTNG